MRRRLTRRELRRLRGKQRSAEAAFTEQVVLWLNGGRAVTGLQDLRESADEFRDAIGMLVNGDR